MILTAKHSPRNLHQASRRVGLLYTGPLGFILRFQVYGAGLWVYDVGCGVRASRV